MIRGQVALDEGAVVLLSVFGPTGAALQVDAVIDTGFEGELALPADAVAALGLRPLGELPAILADGTLRELGAFAGAVDWHGQIRPVLAVEVDGPVLVGLRLLQNCDLAMRVVEGGEVTITPVE